MVHPGAERRPPSSIPLGNSIDWDAVGYREPPPSIEVAAQQRERIHCAVSHSRTERSPTFTVPFGNPIGFHSARSGSEITSRIEVSARQRQSVDPVVKSGSKRTPTAAAPFGYMMGLHAARACEHSSCIEIASPQRDRLHRRWIGWVTASDSGTQRKPCAPVPFGNSINSVRARARERTARI